MKWASDTSQTELLVAINSYNHGEVEVLCWQLIDYVNCQDIPYDSTGAEQIVAALQRKRYFELLSRVANVFIVSGIDSPKVRKHYAQSLLDQGQLSAAIPYLQSLVAGLDEILKPPVGKTESTVLVEKIQTELTEARGLLGRAYKQVFVELKSINSPQKKDALVKAVAAYKKPYQEDRKKNIWHGINYVAMLKRADSDGIELEGISDPKQEAEQIASDILSQVQSLWDDRKASMWDCGTAMEACVAISSRKDEAREWLERYVREPYADAFELGSTLRQLEEVWRLSATDEPGASLLPVLRAELLQHEGGGFNISPDKLHNIEIGQNSNVDFEKCFSDARYHSYNFMKKMVACAHSVARIESEPGKGFGTGFLITGSKLHHSFGDESVLLTIAHVISENAETRQALHPEDAIITFELSDNDKEFEVQEVLWSSPPEELDATVLRIRGDLPETKHLVPITSRLPLTDGKQRVYIVGHPKGGGISFSMQDNVLLDHETPYIHYRTPTEGGSSGSPVFNAQWKLIGIHHAGGHELRRLNNKGGLYQANEGIWIQSIIEALTKTFG
jgi:S1-C subfamily serine protease